MNKQILITGANGFIGSHLVQSFLQHGFCVVAGVRKGSNTTSLTAFNVHLLELNYSNKALLTKQLTQHCNQFGAFDVVLHNAGTTRASSDAEFNEVNFVYTTYLVEAIHQAKALQGSFIFMSSLAAFGPGDNQDFTPIQATHVLNPISPYGKSKQQAVAWLRTQQFIPQHIIIYPTAVFGPADKDFFEFIKLIHSGVEPYMGCYEQRLSMIYVKDLVFAITQLVLQQVPQGEFIVSDGSTYTKKQLGSIIKQILGKKTFSFTIPLSLILPIAKLTTFLYSLVTVKKPLLTPEKVKEISAANWLADSSLVWETIQQKPQYTMQQAMHQTIAWYKQQGWL